MKQFKFIVCLFNIVLMVACEEKNDHHPYTFFVAGHTYGSPGDNSLGLYEVFTDRFDILLEDEKMELGFLTGDMVFAPSAAHWDAIDTELAVLGLPVYMVAGNHDVKDRPLFEERYGKTYYDFLLHDDLFIVLDPNLDNWNISGAQFDYLKTTVATHHQSVNNIFVFFHQTLWWTATNKYKWAGFNSLEGRADSINFWTAVEPIFHDLSNPTFMFAGDMGAFPSGKSFMYDHYDNITLIGSGMGGGTADNFVIVEIDNDTTVHFRLISLNGEHIDALGRLEDYTFD